MASAPEASSQSSNTKSDAPSTDANNMQRRYQERPYTSLIALNGMSSSWVAYAYRVQN